LYRTHNYKLGTFLICIDSYDNNNPKGKYFSTFNTEPVEFNSLTQLLLNIQNNMESNISSKDNTNIYPIVSFSNNSKIDSNGKSIRFIIDIMFKQNSSWQGILFAPFSKKNN